MARLSRSAYALLVSLLPATATMIGIVVLVQIPSLIEITGVALVVVGVGLHREASPSLKAAPPPQADSETDTAQAS